MIRVLVSAAYPTVRTGLAAVARARPGLEVVGEAGGAGDLPALLASLRPDVLLMELESGQEDLAGVVWQALEAAPSVAVVLLANTEGRWMLDALRIGVRAVLGRDASAQAIGAAIEAAAEGLVVVAASAVTLLPAAAVGAAVDVGAPGEALTPRELEVLRLVSEGLGNKIISRRLGISEHTVKFHVAAIMAKLGAASRTEAVTQAARRGMIML